FPWALARLLPFGCTGTDKSRSTSASPPGTANIKRPVLVPASARRSPSFVIVKLQPGRSPPTRQVTSLDPWHPLLSAPLSPPPVRPTSHMAPRECRNARRRETPRGGSGLVRRVS